MLNAPGLPEVSASYPHLHTHPLPRASQPQSPSVPVTVQGSLAQKSMLLEISQDAYTGACPQTPSSRAQPRHQGLSSSALQPPAPRSRDEEVELAGAVFVGWRGPRGLGLGAWHGPGMDQYPAGWPPSVPAGILAVTSGQLLAPCSPSSSRLGYIRKQPRGNEVRRQYPTPPSVPFMLPPHLGHPIPSHLGLTGVPSEL